MLVHVRIRLVKMGFWFICFAKGDGVRGLISVTKYRLLQTDKQNPNAAPDQGLHYSPSYTLKTIVL